MSDIVYIGIKGCVIAYNRETGERLWEKELEGSGFVNLLVDGDRLIATTHGEVFCFDAVTGEPLWHDPLAGYGYGIATIATPRAAFLPVGPQEQATQQQTAATVAVIAATS